MEVIRQYGVNIILFLVIMAGVISNIETLKLALGCYEEEEEK